MFKIHHCQEELDALKIAVRETGWNFILQHENISTEELIMKTKELPVRRYKDAERLGGIDGSECKSEGNSEFAISL